MTEIDDQANKVTIKEDGTQQVSNETGTGSRRMSLVLPRDFKTQDSEEDEDIDGDNETQDVEAKCADIGSIDGNTEISKHTYMETIDTEETGTEVLEDEELDVQQRTPTDGRNSKPLQAVDDIPSKSPKSKNEHEVVEQDEELEYGSLSGSDNGENAPEENKENEIWFDESEGKEGSPDQDSLFSQSRSPSPAPMDESRAKSPQIEKKDVGSDVKSETPQAKPPAEISVEDFLSAAKKESADKKKVPDSNEKGKDHKTTDSEQNSKRQKTGTTTKPTKVTKFRQMAAAIKTLDWTHELSQNRGKIVRKGYVHMCERCDAPILIYGRLMPCNHIFCGACAKNFVLKVCIRCGERVESVETFEIGRELFICREATAVGRGLCGKCHFSLEDLRAHQEKVHWGLQDAAKSSGPYGGETGSFDRKQSAHYHTGDGDARNFIRGKPYSRGSHRYDRPGGRGSGGRRFSTSQRTVYK
eukprot:m.30630 g.30630  ORF g.30630 m.30630 type:complete len:471 (+) comp8220_c0_seq1:1816-3228(+)